MARYHISDGEAKVCTAKPCRCPIAGSPMLPDAGHYPTKEAANKEVERLARVEEHRAKARQKAERSRLIRREPSQANAQEIHAQNFDNFRDLDNPILPLNAFEGEKRQQWLEAYADYVSDEKYLRRVPEIYSMMKDSSNEKFGLKEEDYETLKRFDVDPDSGRTRQNEDAYRRETVANVNTNLIPQGKKAREANYEKYGFSGFDEGRTGEREEVMFDRKKLGDDDIINHYQLNAVLGNQWDERKGGYGKAKSYVESYDHRTGKATIVHND